MKKVFLSLILFIALGSVSKAQVTVDVFINSGGLSYKKSTYKNIDKLTIQIQGKSVDGGYYRKVHVIGDDVTPILIADETVGAVGQIILTNKDIIKRLKNGKPITLYVEKTPANTKSTEPVSKVYIGTLTREK